MNKSLRKYKDEKTIPISLINDVAYQLNVSSMAVIALTNESSCCDRRDNTAIFSQLLSVNSDKLALLLAGVVRKNFLNRNTERPDSHFRTLSFDAVASYAKAHGGLLMKAFKEFGGDSNKKSFLLYERSIESYVSELVEMSLPKAIDFTRYSGKRLSSGLELLYRFLKSAEILDNSDFYRNAFFNIPGIEVIEGGVSSYIIGPKSLIPSTLNG